MVEGPRGEDEPTVEAGTLTDVPNPNPTPSSPSEGGTEGPLLEGGEGEHGTTPIDWSEELRGDATAALRRAQEAEPFASRMIQYLTAKELPDSDPYLRHRVLKAHEDFIVDPSSGLLCRLW